MPNFIKKPVKPIRPEPPSKIIKEWHVEQLSYHTHSIADLVKTCGPADLAQCYIKLESYDYDYENSNIYLHYYRDVENVHFESQSERHVRDLAKYELKMAEYKTLLAQYDAEEPARKEDEKERLVKRNESEVKRLKAQIARQQKQLKKLGAE